MTTHKKEKIRATIRRQLGIPAREGTFNQAELLRILAYVTIEKHDEADRARGSKDSGTGGHSLRVSGLGNQEDGGGSVERRKLGGVKDLDHLFGEGKDD